MLQIYLFLGAPATLSSEIARDRPTVAGLLPGDTSAVVG
jgi:hypothetical protein